MNILETKIRTLLCFVLLVGFLGTSAVCNAQDEAKPDMDPRTQRSLPEETNKYSKQKFDIMFEKPLSVEDFVASLRTKTNDSVNIVVAWDARKVMIPSLELRQVSILSALDAMWTATKEEVWWDDGDDAFIKILRKPDSELEMGHSNYRGSETAVMNVANIVDQNEKAEASMLSAIEIGLEMSSSSPENVNIKFHKETKLLFIRATRSDINIVSQVIDQIGKGIPKRKSGGFGGNGVRSR